MKARRTSRKVNRAWLHDHLTDPYVRQAQADGYRSRAAYKLQEIDESLGLLRFGQTVVDLGSAPGAWSQYLRRRLGPPAAGGGRIVALDLLPMIPVDGVSFIHGDFREPEAVAELERALDGAPVDVVVSDMAPNLSGIAPADSARIAHLVELAMDFAQAHLRPQGVLVCKVFHGSGYSQLVRLFKDRFRVVKPVKPKASRDRSAETFLVGIGLKSGV
jgi:23S rRNA (uridine2552-2'-O)-methyltransferase